MESTFTVTRLITLLARKSQICITEVLKDYGITAAEQPFFMAIEYSDGMTQEELTAMISVDKAATTRAVCSLEAKGYLIRKQDTKDHRKNLIYPTEKTHELYPKIHETLLALNDRITEGLSKEEQDTVCRSMFLMVQNFQKMSKGKGGERYASRVH